MPNVAKCLFRLLTFHLGARPAVTERYFYTFRRCYQVYRAVASVPRVRVQLQQLVPIGWAHEDRVIETVEWCVVLDNKALGDVRSVTNPGMR